MLNGNPTASMTIASLKSQKIWLCWNSKPRKDRISKVPCAASGAPCGTDEKYRNRLVTYEEAVKAQKGKHFSGVGFVIPSNIVFIDIDHFRRNKTLAETLQARFNCYCETSVSGDGLHLYAMYDADRLIAEAGNLNDYYFKNSKINLEVYMGGVTNRFSAFTGNAVDDKPLMDCTDALLYTLKHEMLRKPGKVKKSEKTPDAISDKLNSGIDINVIVDERLAYIRKKKNAPKFFKLFTDGDRNGYASDSESDQALFTMAAYYCGNNPDLIKALVMKSALRRDKWNRDDYMRMSIESAIDFHGGHFDPSVMPKERPPFVRVTAKGAEFIANPLLADYVRDNVIYRIVRDKATPGAMIYVYEDGCYRLYAPDIFKGLIKGFIESYDKLLLKMSNVEETFKLLMTDLAYTRIEELNADETLINFRNGLLKVTADSLELLPHTSDVLSTIQIPADWNGVDSGTPVFDSYLSRLVGYRNDTRECVLEFIGAVLSNVRGWRMKKALFFVGAGDTGKSVLKTLVERFLGKGNFIGIDLQEIEARFGTSAIYSKRLAGSSDMSFVSVDELKTFKKVTGGDSLFAEFKGQPIFEFTYSGLLWFCMNRLPKFGGDDGEWVYNRIMVVDCPNQIPLSEQDKCLIEHLYEERDGIIFKAVKAFQRVVENGYRFTESQSIINARKNYVNHNSTIISFFRECIVKRDVKAKMDGCTTGKIYDVYKAWCRDNNNGYAKTAREFREGVASYIGMDFSDMTIHTQYGTQYREFTITDEAKSHYNKEYGFDGSDFLAC